VRQGKDRLLLPDNLPVRTRDRSYLCCAIFLGVHLTSIELTFVALVSLYHFIQEFQ